MVFSLTNAFALEGAQSDGTPLTSASQLCKQLKGNYPQTIEDIKLQGLSLQLSKEEIKKRINDVRVYKKLACDEAKDAENNCQKLRKGYEDNIAFANAKGLSLQLSEQEVDAIVINLKMEKKYWCGKATPLTSAAKLCREAKKSFKSDVEGIKAKGLSLQLSPEEIEMQIKDLKNYKNKICQDKA